MKDELGGKETITMEIKNQNSQRSVSLKETLNLKNIKTD